METSATDVVVVGAGIIGCSIAYRLSQSGQRVVVVEAGAQPGCGSTGASSSIVRFHYSLKSNMAMAWDSYHAWINWEDELGGVDPDGMIEYRETGGLLLGAMEDFTGMVDNFDSLGIGYEVMAASRVREQFPAIDPAKFGPPSLIDDPGFVRDPDGELSGLFTPAAGYINDPQLAARNYAWAATREGVSFRFKTRVVAISSVDGAISGVTLDQGDFITAKTVINAAGPASDRLSQLAGVAESHRVRSRPLLTETHVAHAPPNFVGPQATFVFDPDVGSAFRPDIGDMVHVSNVEPECDELHWVDDPWNHPDLPTVDCFQTQVMRVARRMPDMGIPPRPVGLSALYDVTPDWNPLIDRTDLDGFYLACGTSGNSFKTAPTIGQIISRMVTQPEFATFETLRTGHEVDLGHYGRNRMVAASTNVMA